MSLSTYNRLKARFVNTRERRRRDAREASLTPAGMQTLEPRTLLSAVLTDAIPDQYITASGGTAAINLSNHFDDTDINGTVVRYDTVFGEFDVELFDAITVNTVLNFLGYVDRGDYDGTFIHRNAYVDPNNTPNDSSDDVPFVVQGGGFIYEAPSSYNEIFQGPSVINEPGISNTRGTIAMAKLGGDPDSATNQWFFNMGDNSANLDNQNGGFTVFGQVLGNGMDVVDMIAETPVWNASSLNGAFSDLPLRDFTNDHYPNNNDLVVINSITRVSELSYRVVSVSAPNRVAAVIDETGLLTVFTIGNSRPESVTITVEAEDLNGNTTQETFTVNVGAAKESLTNDDSADLVWRNFGSGKNTLWEMRAFNHEGVTALNDVNNGTWYIAAVGDLNQDGSNDLLWRNAFDGQNKVWLMDGSDFVSAVDLRTVANSDWVVGGIADFNNDGHNDILWRNHDKGRNVVWTMDGTVEVEGGSMRLAGQSGADWYIGGVGDFNMDGAADIFWRNDSSGFNKVWLMNPFDGSRDSEVALLTLGNTAWVASGVADWNLNDQVDILFRNVNSGRQMVWVMNGTTRSNERRDIPVLRNQDWQLPGRTSQVAAEGNALAKIQRLKKKRAQAKTASSTGSSQTAVAASAQSSGTTVSLLSEVDPIITLDNGDEDNGFVLDDNGQVVR